MGPPGLVVIDAVSEAAVEAGDDGVVPDEWCPVDDLKSEASMEAILELWHADNAANLCLMPSAVFQEEGRL